MGFSITQQPPDRWNGQDPAFRLDILAGRCINRLVMGTNDVALKMLYAKFQPDIEHQLETIFGPAKPVRTQTHRRRTKTRMTKAKAKSSRSKPKPIEQARVTKVEFLS